MKNWLLELFDLHKDQSGNVIYRDHVIVKVIKAYDTFDDDIDIWCFADMNHPIAHFGYAYSMKDAKSKIRKLISEDK